MATTANTHTTFPLKGTNPKDPNLSKGSLRDSTSTISENKGKPLLTVTLRTAKMRSGRD